MAKQFNGFLNNAPVVKPVTRQVLGSELTVGMRYWDCGGLYEIKSIFFEESFPRYVVQSKWVRGANGDFYPNSMSAGLRADLTWTVEA